MIETKPKRTFESSIAFNFQDRKAPGQELPPLEKLTPTRYARMNPNQRREMITRLIEFLKTF